MPACFEKLFFAVEKFAPESKPGDRLPKEKGVSGGSSDVHRGLIHMGVVGQRRFYYKSTRRSMDQHHSLDNTISTNMKFLVSPVQYGFSQGAISIAESKFERISIFLFSIATQQKYQFSYLYIGANIVNKSIYKKFNI